MSVISFKQELAKARAGHYAIPLFDVFDLAGIEGLWESLTALKAPTIFGIYSAQAAQPYAKALSAFIRTRFEQTSVPVSIMLDHGASVAQCLQVLDYGFTDVMYDGSQLPFDENIANTRIVVQAAHSMGVAVEAELGHVGSGSDYDSYGGRALGFTDLGQVDTFIEKTGVDFLAIAFGNAHGLYKGDPKLNLDLVSEVNRRVSIPLVMHGGSGSSDEQFQGAIAAGIAKINFATLIINSATEKMKKAAASPDGNLFSINDGVRAAYKDWSDRLYHLFGTAGKG